MSERYREWYHVEELVPAEHAVGGKAFWMTLDERGHPLRLLSPDVARATARKLQRAGRVVRLVRLTEEVVPPLPRLRMLKTIVAELPGDTSVTAVKGGRYDAAFDPQGAVSAVVDGELLGLKPGEYEWVNEG